MCFLFQAGDGGGGEAAGAETQGDAQEARDGGGGGGQGGHLHPPDSHAEVSEHTENSTANMCSNLMYGTISSQ